MVVDSSGEMGVRVVSAGNDGIWIRNAAFQTSASGRNVGPTALEPGGVVAVQDVGRPEPGHTEIVMRVSRASGPDAVIGVVSGRVEFDKADDETDLVLREGPAEAGE